MIFDTFYAMVDRADDVKIGIKSTAILFGKWDKLVIGILQILFLLLLIIVGYLFNLNKFYFLSLLVAAILFLYQQVLIKDRHRGQCFKAFLNNHWVGLVIFVGIVMDYSL